MDARELVGGSAQRGDEIFQRNLVQMKCNQRALDCRRFGSGKNSRGFSAGFVQRRSGGNNSRLYYLSRRGREVHRRREPLVELGLARKSAAKDLSLQLGEFELLICGRIIGAE